MNMKSPYKVYVLKSGYSRHIPEGMEANCTCTLIKGPKNIIVDTMTPWDTQIILDGLKKYDVKCDDISYVVSTHGHSDHTGNNNLFLKAKHIVGFSVSFGHTYYDHSFLYDEKLLIDDYVQVIATPGHTATDVSVLVMTEDLGLVAVTGDLFEREEDLKDSSLWMISAASESPKIQEDNRNKILQLADCIIPGHGPMFKVTKQIKDEALDKNLGQHYI